MKDGKQEAVWKETGLDGHMITNANSQPHGGGMGGQWEVTVSFNNEGTKLFGDITTRLVGKPIAIELDGRIISAPNVHEPITGGTASISGSFTAKDAQELALKLRAGQFPVPLKMIENRTVGPTLGEEAVDKSMVAGAFGLGALRERQLRRPRLFRRLRDGKFTGRPEGFGTVSRGNTNVGEELF